MWMPPQLPWLKREKPENGMKLLIGRWKKGVAMKKKPEQVAGPREKQDRPIQEKKPAG